MDADRWEKVQDLFHHAVALEGNDRDEFLKGCRHEDPQDADLLIRMVAEDGKNSQGWERGLASAVSRSSTWQALAIPAEDLGPYEFLRPLGQGGMGTVYQARHRRTGQMVAVKVLRSGELSAASRERFSTEQRALARLNHPLIARLYASEAFRDGTPCFIMEYVEGQPLVAWCLSRGTSVRERVLLFRQVCEAVQHAHQHAIIHRDLKPSNILVRADGAVRLLDFGIAKQLDTADVSLTDQQPAPLTLAYAAPEQVSGGSVGTHTDIYALGVIFYELLTERPAVDLTGLTPGGVEMAIRERNPAPPSKFMRRFGNGLDRKDLDLICETAIHKDPDHRYKSVEALIRDLDHWLRSEPLDARPESPVYRLSRFAQRNRLALALTVAVVLLIVSGTAIFAVGLARARDAAVHEQTRTKRLEEFVLSLFDNGDAEAGPSKSATAMTMLERGRKVADTLRNDPQFQTDLYEVLGNLYRKAGRLEDSGALLELASARRVGHVDATTREQAESLTALALLRSDQSKFAEGEKLARRALAIERADKKAAPQDIASAEQALGEILDDSRHFKESILVLEDALRLQSQPGGSDSEKAKTLGTLAEAQQEAGNFAESERLNMQGLAIDRRIYGESHPVVAVDFMRLGHLRQVEQRYADAVTEYRKALSIFERWYGKENPKRIEVLVTMGQALVYEGQYDEARRALQEGIALAAQVVGPTDAFGTFALSALGTLEQKTGNLPQAEAYFKQAIESGRALWGKGSYEVAVGTSNLANVELAERRYARAEALFREAMRNFVNDLPPGNPDIGRVELNLGRTLISERKYGEAAEMLTAATSLLSRQPASGSVDLRRAQDALVELRRLRGY